jgi:hypothetical protein
MGTMTQQLGSTTAIAVALCACGDGGGAEGAATSAASASAEASSGEGSTGGASNDDALAFFPRIVGLWAGPVDSTTSVGDFPIKNMDVRAADANTLFSRVDLDGGNSLRYAFAFEHQGDRDVLVFRNGGYFQGVLRDTRTELVEADLAEERWRFCAIGPGCGYVEATFDFEGEDHLDMHVDVMMMTHFDWPAVREQPRELPQPFPADPSGQPGDQPFPDMPTLRVTASWSTPLAADTPVWIVLSTEACFPAGACTPSRFISATAAAGSTSVEIPIEQIHAGDYFANGMLDRNGNLAGTLFPDGGDTVSVPPDRAITVAPSGETTLALVLSYDL